MKFWNWKFSLIALVVFVAFRMSMTLPEFMAEEESQHRGTAVAAFYDDVRAGQPYIALQQTLAGMTVIDQVNHGNVMIVGGSMISGGLQDITPDQAGTVESRFRRPGEPMSQSQKDNVKAWMAWLDHHMYNSDTPEILLLQEYIRVTEQMLNEFIRTDFSADPEAVTRWEQIPVVAWLYYGVVMTLDSNRCGNGVARMQGLYENLQSMPEMARVQERWLAYDPYERQELMNRAMMLEGLKKERLPMPYFCGVDHFDYRMDNRADLIERDMMMPDAEWQSWRPSLRSDFQRAVMADKG